MGVCQSAGVTAESGEPATARRHWRADLALIRQRDLGLLVGSRLVSITGTAMAPVALAFGVLDLPGATASSLGIVLFAQAVPQVLFMLVGGVLADRGSRAKVMVTAECLAGGAAVATAVLLISGHASIPALAGLAAVGGLAVALFSPAYTGIVPEVVADSDLQSANALLRLASNVARIAGAALAGVLVAVVGAGWAMAIDGSTFLVSAVLIAMVRVRRKRHAADATAGVLRQLQDGWGEFVSRRWVVVIVVLFAISNVGFSATIGVLGPVQAQRSLGGAGPWAAVVTAFSVGMVVGVALALRLRPRRPMLVACALVPGFALPVLALAAPLSIVVIAAFALLAGVVSDVFGVLWDTALQQHVQPESLSRVSSYDWLGSLALVPLGLAAAGPLADRIGLEATLVVAGALCVLPVFALLDPQVRGLRAGRPADAS